MSNYLAHRKDFLARLEGDVLKVEKRVEILEEEVRPTVKTYRVVRTTEHDERPIAFGLSLTDADVALKWARGNKRWENVDGVSYKIEEESL